MTLKCQYEHITDDNESHHHTSLGDRYSIPRERFLEQLEWKPMLDRSICMYTVSCSGHHRLSLVHDKLTATRYSETLFNPCTTDDTLLCGGWRSRYETSNTMHGAAWKHFFKFSRNYEADASEFLEKLKKCLS